MGICGCGKDEKHHGSAGQCVWPNHAAYFQMPTWTTRPAPNFWGMESSRLHCTVGGCWHHLRFPVSATRWAW